MYLHLVNSSPIHILLADDDLDDCMFFEEALQELKVPFDLTTANNGEQLMQLLSKTNKLPCVLFLDLNMPRKNGFECLVEIKKSDKLKELPVVIYSTSFSEDVAESLYQNGARHYIRKSGDFSKLKQMVDKALKLVTQTKGLQAGKEKFVI